MDDHCLYVRVIILFLTLILEKFLINNNVYVFYIFM